MRSIVIALSLAALASAATLAFARTGAERMRPAGTLTCTTNPHVGLVFGTTRAATCTVVGEADGRPQDYGALFPRAGRDRDVTRSETLAWRIHTADGALRPGELEGLFSGDPAATLPAFRAERRAIRLEPIRPAADAGLNFAEGTPRLLLGAVRASY
ncbi:DUF992 domain-containing protein [Methylobacterium nodulans]|uniref:DUF992 domain-containing protein n=1 Tax=Methylobacterium nodulans (strain LMG 21967 / CNCM I-2342 / ORS 2060) TaxID=460265 RepID=B8IQZ1_METNO|nr:DUF992 domain-containing protein [Methylobacterium nodulans]ACL56693.1 conserved hypothetical protein [Methylobacterium nodulans ORS 2060]